jgi:hypothetical protein
MRNLPIACTLDGPALAERLAEIRAVGREAFIGAETDGAVRFHATPAIRARLEQIVAAEAECCPFLGLELSQTDDELRLTIAAPEGAELVRTELVAAFAG